MSLGSNIGTSRRTTLLLPMAALLLWAVALALHTFHGATPARLAALDLLLPFILRRRSLTFSIFFSMVLGVEYGLDLPHAALATRVFSDIFLRLIRSIIAPLIFGTLVTGIAGHGGTARVGRLGWKSLLYFEVLTTAALVIGLVAIHLSHAGVGVAVPAADIANAAALQPATTWQLFLLHVFPDNIAHAVADDQILQVAVFALLFGLALRRVPAPRQGPMLALVESLTATMFAFTNLVMYFAPVGVAAALAYTIASGGLGVIGSLGRLLFTLYAALAAFASLAMLPAALVARIPVRAFLRAIAEPATIAFATATSEAALPLAMERMEAFGVPRPVLAFVLPAGYSFNLAGSALYLAIASVFTAQAAGQHLGLRQQTVMLLVLMLTSKGVAGVPRAVLVVLLATAGTFHLPEGPIFLILGIDALMDMGRTVINVSGNCLAAAVIARWEGVLKRPTEA